MHLLPLLPAHARLFHAAMQETDFVQWLKFEQGITQEQLEERFAHWARRNEDGGGYIRCIAVDDVIIGVIGAYRTKDVTRLFYFILPEYQNKGYGTDALGIFLQECAWRPLCAYVKDGNTRSETILKKYSFTVSSIQDKEDQTRYELS